MSPHFILVHVVAALLTVGTASVRADDPTLSAGTSDAGTSNASTSNAGTSDAAANDAPAALSAQAPPEAGRCATWSGRSAAISTSASVAPRP